MFNSYPCRGHARIRLCASQLLWVETVAGRLIYVTMRGMRSNRAGDALIPLLFNLDVCSAECVRVVSAEGPQTLFGLCLCEFKK